MVVLGSTSEYDRDRFFSVEDHTRPDQCPLSLLLKKYKSKKAHVHKCAFEEGVKNFFLHGSGRLKVPSKYRKNRRNAHGKLLCTHTHVSSTKRKKGSQIEKNKLLRNKYSVRNTKVRSFSPISIPRAGFNPFLLICSPVQSSEVYCGIQSSAILHSSQK